MHEHFLEVNGTAVIFMCMGKPAKEDPVLLEDPPFTSLQIHVQKQIGNLLKMWVCVVSVKFKQFHNNIFSE